MEGNARTSHEPERQHARQSSPGAGLPAAYPRKSSPNAAPPATFPRKSSPNAPENSIFRPFWACGANFFAHRTQPRADFETNDTTAGTDVGQHETAITNATEKRTKNTHFSPAKATPVSTQHSHKVGKASPVSPQRSDALDTAPMHQIAQHCTGN